MSYGRPLRSMLFVPGNKARMLEKARTLAADAVILDLEDAVPPDEKTTARAMVREALEAGTYSQQVIVRLNAFDTGLLESDLRAILVPGVGGVCLPKAGRARDVERLATLVATLEQERGLAAGAVELFLMIETALGVHSAYPLARASQRVRALCFGGEDLSRDLGAVRTKEGLELSYARAAVVLAARAADVLAIDTVYTDLADGDGLLVEARLARQLGYSGKLLIHPAQIEPLHLAFSPSKEELVHARRILAAFEDAQARGEGVIVFEGKMIDEPIVARAREVLALAETAHSGHGSQARGGAR